MMVKITAVIVTYNRLRYLKRVVDSLRGQTIPLDNIIVIDNGTTDGTHEWLDEQRDLIVMHQDNVGGSGGFYRGIQEALKLGNDWIWCMDDDVYPRKDCLEQLLKYDNENVGVLCPRRIQQGKDFLSEVKTLNLSNPFKRLHQTKVSVHDISKGMPIEIVGMVFEGPLFKREVIEKIGLPTKEFFILFDDTDYSYRAVKAGYKVMYIPNAILEKELFFQNVGEVEQRRKNKWKLLYDIRNRAYFCHHYGKNFFYRHFGEIHCPIHMTLAILFNLPLNNKYEKEDLLKVWSMYFRGHREELGKM